MAPTPTDHNPIPPSIRSSDTAPVLQVRDLRVEFNTDRGHVVAVNDVSFDLWPGRTLGLVGESGSGKTVMSLSLLGLVRAPGRVTGGSVVLDGRDLRQLPDRELADVRGREISMIFQDARRSLDPAFPVGDQIAEVARRHLGLTRKHSWERAVELLELVRIPAAKRRAKEYPHTFSGGMAQRVLLAMALAGDPKVLVADEPTTALDVTVQHHMLRLLADIQRELDLSIVFITHDLAVVSEMCHDVVVMYAGQLVEQAPAETLFNSPAHPYTQTLLDSLPQAVRGSRRLPVTGAPPNPYHPPTGCRFHPRCPHMEEACRTGELEVRPVADHQVSRCRRTAELSLRGIA